MATRGGCGGVGEVGEVVEVEVVRGHAGGLKRAAREERRNMGGVAEGLGG